MRREISISTQTLIYTAIAILGAILIFTLPIDKSNTYNNTPTQAVQELNTVPAATFKQLLEQNQGYLLLDVRTPEEYAQEHIANAINIDFYAPDFREKLAQLDKNKTYFIYCRSGNRSGQTLQIMKELGFKKVYNLAGGIKAWKSAGYEVVR